MNQGQKVKVINTYRDDAPDMSGEIIGVGMVTLPMPMTGKPTSVPIYLVKLDEGFWSHENRVFHSIIPVHRANLQLIEESFSDKGIPVSPASLGSFPSSNG